MSFLFHCFLIISLSMESFYLTLPSNSSKSIFPENKLNSYKVKLPRLLPISQGKWEVGLSEIQFPKSWYNLTDAWMRVRTSQSSVPFCIPLKNGFYNNIGELLDHMREKLSADVRFPDKIRLTFDSISNRVILHILVNSDKTPISISFSQNLINILGFAKSKSEGDFFSQGVFVDGPADINEGFSALYVYTDVVENQFVGDYMVPLLKVVAFDNESKKRNVSVSFNRVQYLAVLDRRTDSIEVNIRRDNGESVPFQDGEVVITLHFRKIR